MPAGSLNSGVEDILDGPLLPKTKSNRAASAFAQPSGLACDGESIYVADSEGSSIRQVPLAPGSDVTTLVGSADQADRRLFSFGDRDGPANAALLQHPLDVACEDGKLYIADTYNSKIKVLDPAKRTCETFVGGDKEGWLAGPVFNEPGGIHYADGKFYVADTNAHRIRIVDVKTKAVSTLKLSGVEAPKGGK